MGIKNLDALKDGEDAPRTTCGASYEHDQHLFGLEGQQFVCDGVFK